MGALPEFFSAASSVSGYGTTSISLAAFVPAVTASINPSPATVSSLSKNTATILSTVATTATAILVSEGDSRPDVDNGDCQLLGPFSILIQASLGGLALLSLVFKRWRERPQRPLKIWGFDVSKQVVGSILLHLANLLMSMLSSGQLKPSPKVSGYTANPCSFYLLNLAIDTTVGIPILIILLRLLTYGFLLTPFGNPPQSIESGNYGQPPKAQWWLKQCLIYFIGLLGMKFFVFLFFSLCPWIIHVGDWALRWTEGNEMVQVFFVMLFFPLIMNVLQYYIIDGFIKNKKPSDHELIPSEDDESEDRQEERGSGQQDNWDAAFDGQDESDRPKRSSRSGSHDRVTKLKVNPKKLDEYNPYVDGDTSTVGESSDNSPGKGDKNSLLKDR